MLSTKCLAVNAHSKSGPPTVLTEEEENSLACYCVQMADMGFGLTQEDVMRTTFTVVECSGRVHPFTDGMAGRARFNGFKAHYLA